MESRPVLRDGSRVRALDGLRGLAAATVVASHAMLLVPSVNNAFHGRVHGDGFAWWLTFTPAHTFWAGTEAVIVFFVLSGFVLTRAADREGFSWRSYYPARLIRLYLPSVAALLIGAGLVKLSEPRALVPNPSQWLEKQRHVPTNAHAIFHDALLLRGVGLIDPVLWSLKWEVIFSLLLPIAVYGVSRRVSIAVATGVLLLGVTALGFGSSARGYLLYLPMFGVGALMARNQKRLAEAGGRLRRLASAALLACALVLLTMMWSFQLHHQRVTYAGEVVGAALIVFLFGFDSSVRSLGEHRTIQWLGSRSFCLYLVHFPILIAIAFAMGRYSRFACVPGVPAALLASEVFYRCIEAPAHRLARGVKAAGRKPELAVRHAGASSG